jgi:hypothetical protein
MAEQSISLAEKILSHPIVWGVLACIALAVAFSGRISMTAAAVFMWVACALATFGGYRLFAYLGAGLPIRLLSSLALGCVFAIATILAVRWLNSKAESAVLLTPEITWHDPDPIEVGAGLSEKQLNASVNVDAAPTYDPKTGTILPIGRHPLTVIFAPADATTYAKASKTVYLVVNARPEVPPKPSQSRVDPFKSALIFHSITTGIGNLPERKRVTETWDEKPWDEANYADVRLQVDNSLDFPLDNLDLNISVAADDKSNAVAGIGQLSDLKDVEFHRPPLDVKLPDLQLVGKDGKTYRLPTEELFGKMHLPTPNYRVTCQRLLAKDSFRLIIATTSHSENRRIPPERLRITGSYEMAKSEGGARERVDAVVVVEK